MSEITYKTQVLVGGGWFQCVESYESIFERMRDSNFKLGPDENEEAGSMRWAAPIELTVRSSEEFGGVPMRIAVQPMALAAVIDVPDANQEAVLG